MARKKNANDESEDTLAIRDEWLNTLRALNKNVQAWAEELDWSTRIFSKKMQDSRLGKYDAPCLMMQKETTRVLLDPVARFAPGTDGVVDLYLMPAYDDIASVYSIKGGWRLQHWARGTDEHAPATEPATRPLTKEVLAEVLDEMLAHAAESY